MLLAGCQNNFIAGKSNNKNNIEVSDKPQPGVVAVIDSDIIINQPLSNDTISSPVEITGRARSGEGAVYFRLKDGMNKAIAEGSATAPLGGSGLGFYSGKLEFDRPTTQNGWLEVYTKDAQDNSEQNLISLPIVFKEFSKPKIKLYFSNIKEDPNVLDCSKVFMVEREIEPTNQIVKSVISELIKGVTEEEMANGYLTNLPETAIELKSMDLKDGVLTVDFNQALQEGVGGSCRVIAIRSQITETLKQFENVKEVIISIDGKTEDILQP